MSGTGAKRAVDWLVSAAPDPAACRWTWERDPSGVVLLPAGRLWDVLILPERLGALTLAVLDRRTEPTGPVLGGAGAGGGPEPGTAAWRSEGRRPDARVGFFVPPGTADRWIGTHVRGAGAGTWVVVPHPGRTAGGARRPTGGAADGARYPGRTAGGPGIPGGAAADGARYPGRMDGGARRRGRSAGGARWLVAPDGSGHLTDPGLLELVLHESVVELVREDPC